MQPALAVSVAGGGSDVAPRLMSAAAEIFGVTPGRMRSADRGDATVARWALSWVLIEHVGWSAARVGRLLGKHHTAILYGHRRAAEMRRTSEGFFNALCMLETKLCVAD